VVKQRAEIETIKAGISRLEKILPTIRERVEGRRKLVEKKIVAKLAFAELEAQLFDHEGQLKVQRRKLAESRAAMKVVESQRGQLEAEFRHQVMAELAEAHDLAATTQKEYIKAEERSRLQTLTAPVDGTVQQLAVHTIGGVVMPAQELMVIVPADSRLEIEALVFNKDIGFVHAGQKAELKIESFPFTKYGTIGGTILHVSADAVPDERVGLVYPARVAMARLTILVDDKLVSLSPGMAVTVEIKTGKRRVIDFLLAPLQRDQDESLKER
jgi:hemolysin D